MLPDVCLGCLKRKNKSVHKCSPYLIKAPNAEGTLCASCKCHKMLCTSPNLHQAVTVPESFAAAGLMETDYTLVASSVGASSSPWPLQVLNKGGLGQQTLLTSKITLKNGNESVSVRVLWDSGSESIYTRLKPLFLWSKEKGQ